jgi:type IX secretion system PorP/SprF family membrane protein
MNNPSSNIRTEKMNNQANCSLSKTNHLASSGGISQNKLMTRKTYIEIVIVALLTLLALHVFGQQETMLTQYSTGLQMTNPAYVGTSGRLNAIGLIRNQWLGFEGAPKSQVLLINTPLLRYHLGVGFTLIKDEIGPTNQTLLYANVAYNFNLTDKIKLSMGLNGGLSVKKLNNSSLTPLLANDPVYSEPNVKDYLPNFGAGLYIYSQKFYLGFSSPKLLKNDYKTLSESANAGNEPRHFFVIGGYLLKLSELWKAKPSFSLKMVQGAPLSFDITANAIYHDKFWIGTMFRLGDAVGFIFQYQISDKLRLGYSYDLPITEMLKSTTGSHEISISYDILFKDRKNASPRYF